MMMDQTSDVKLENLTQVSVHGSHLGQCETLSDDVSDEPSSPESATFDDSDLLSGGSYHCNGKGEGGNHESFNGGGKNRQISKEIREIAIF